MPLSRHQPYRVYLQSMTVTVHPSIYPSIHSPTHPLTHPTAHLPNAAYLPCRQLQVHNLVDISLTGAISIGCMTSQSRHLEGHALALLTSVSERPGGEATLPPPPPPIAHHDLHDHDQHQLGHCHYAGTSDLSWSTSTRSALASEATTASTSSFGLASMHPRLSHHEAPDMTVMF
jgi:hypothetical protein